MKALYIIWTLALIASVPLLAQEEIVSQKVGYKLSSGKHSGKTSSNARTSGETEQSNHRVAYQTTVSHPESPFMRLYFGDTYLGEHSYLTVTSVLDGSEQRLDAQSLKDWNYSTGYFNGSSVKVRLYVDPSDADVYFNLRELMVGEEKGNILKKSSDYRAARSTDGPEDTQSICGVDNRVATTDRAIGRLTDGLNSRCTVYITANGTLLTAGHCRDWIVNEGLDVVEFDIPPSNNNTLVNHPNIRSQYPINVGSIQFENGNIGDDWCVFQCNSNSENLTPGWGQGTFFRLTRDFNPNTVRITGCGVDDGVNNRSLQTDAGPLNSEAVSNATRASLSYTVDTESGNSGSPIIWNGTRTVLGIHTNGGCSSTGGSNSGTSFEADDVESAINRNISTNAVHVDGNHPSNNQDGSVMRPFTTLNTATANASSGALLSIAPGAYREEVVLRNVWVQAPVGEVAIGPNANARTSSDSPKSSAIATIAPVQDIEEESIIAERDGSIYPNPFANDITVSYSMEGEGMVDLAVFDLAGHQVEHFIKHEAQKAGNHEMKFDTSRLPTGIYIYRLKHGERETKGKLIKR